MASNTNALLWPIGGLGGRSLTVPIVASASTGTWRVAAYTDPKRPPVGETTFMVEDYVPDRIEFSLTSTAKGISRNAPAQLGVDGHFLYGAPASKLDLSGEVTVGVAKERAGFPGYAFGLFDDEVTAVREELDDLPSHRRVGQSDFSRKARRAARKQRVRWKRRLRSEWRSPAAARSSAS